MKIKKALKEKNKLAGIIAQEFQKVQQYNSVEEGTVRPYAVKDSFESWIAKIEELINLKTRIHRANVKVQEKIFRLSEMKSIVAQLKRLDCTEGKVGSRYGSEPVTRNAVISIVERDDLIKQYEAEIEKIQEELDLFNSKTSV